MQPIEDIVKQHAPLTRSTALKRKSTNSKLNLKTQKNDSIQRQQNPLNNRSPPHRRPVRRLLVPMRAERSLLHLCRMQPRLAVGNSASISPSATRPTTMMQSATGTASAQPSATSDATSTSSSKSGNTATATTTFPMTSSSSPTS